MTLKQRLNSPKSKKATYFQNLWMHIKYWFLKSHKCLWERRVHKDNSPTYFSVFLSICWMRDDGCAFWTATNPLIPAIQVICSILFRSCCLHWNGTSSLDIHLLSFPNAFWCTLRMCHSIKHLAMISNPCLWDDISHDLISCYSNLLIKWLNYIGCLTYIEY